mmetsp:Transcript_44674/g.142517  ORF Transcript_44674/g.142517 Transcript_44674/m.142517 type:complete len:304 (+) Transcript_44674:2-913(+)
MIARTCCPPERTGAKIPPGSMLFQPEEQEEQPYVGGDQVQCERPSEARGPHQEGHGLQHWGVDRRPTVRRLQRHGPLQIRGRGRPIPLQSFAQTDILPGDVGGAALKCFRLSPQLRSPRGRGRGRCGVLRCRRRRRTGLPPALLELGLEPLLGLLALPPRHPRPALRSLGLREARLQRRLGGRIAGGKVPLAPALVLGGCHRNIRGPEELGQPLLQLLQPLPGTLLRGRSGTLRRGCRSTGGLTPAPPTLLPPAPGRRRPRLCGGCGGSSGSLCIRLREPTGRHQLLGLAPPELELGRQGLAS